MIDNSPSIMLVILCAVLVGTGIYLVLERSLTRIILGLSLLANGVNMALLIAGGKAGQPPLVGQAESTEMSDPLAQAMILTAIVITLGTTAFLLAMAYRSWQLDGNDEVQDDLEDRRVAVRAEKDERMVADLADHTGTTEEDKTDIHDETFDETEDETSTESGKGIDDYGQEVTK